MFERFTDRARRVVVLAGEEARQLKHNYIGTEHLLLGLVAEGEGIAAQALESFDVSLPMLRTRVEEIIGQGGQVPVGHIAYTPRAKKVLELSLREALQFGHNYIGTEHILLGLVREGDGVAAMVLRDLGIDDVRRAVIRILTGRPPVVTDKNVEIPKSVMVDYLSWYATFDHQFGPLAQLHPANLMRRYIAAAVDEGR